MTGNVLIGGDFSQNLFQRGTSGSLTGGSANVPTYSAADRWANYGGTSGSETVSVSQQTGSTDIVPGTTASYRVSRSSGTGVAPACISQVVESINSFQFQGQTAEFSFYAKAGPTFSSAASSLAAYITYGTGIDEGSLKLAYNTNGPAAGSTPGWTGGVSAANGVAVPISSGGFNRYAVAAAIPATATELSVTICYTPVGTGASTDWFEIALAQLDINPALTPAVANGAVLLTNDTRIKAFARRPQGLETYLQQRYAYVLNEPATSLNTPTFGYAASATACYATLPLPVAMRNPPGNSGASYPTISGTTVSTITGGTWKVVAAAVAAAVSAIVTYTGNTNTSANLNITTTGMTTGQYCILQGLGGSANIVFAAEL